MSIIIPIITEYIKDIEQSIIANAGDNSSLIADNAEIFSDNDDNAVTIGE